MKLGRLRHATTYEAIQQCHTEKGWCIHWLCDQVGIARASYYQWLKRDVPKAEKENEIISQLIQEYDERFHHILSYRRMTDWINRLNHTHYSRNRIHRLMKELNIHSVIRCKKAKYRRATPEATSENILHRDFQAERPNQKWATDMTEFKWYEGSVVKKLYLSAILDLYDRSIVAYIIADAMTTSWCLTHLSRQFAKIRKHTRCSTVTGGSSIPVKRSSSSSRIRVWSNPCPALGIASIIAQWKGSGEL